MTATRDRKHGEQPTALSYATAAVSGAIVLALVGYLTFHALEPGSPAAITADVVPADAWRRDGLLYVPIDVHNAGGRPASEVVIEMRLEADGGGETTIDYLAGGESQRIYMTAAASADAARVIARVVSFQEP
jgi:uncharacterized protein (TIGR02588 family)